MDKTASLLGLFRHFRRALRGFQFYPADSPVREQAAAEFHQALEAVLLERPAGVSISFLEDGAWIEGCPLSSDPSAGRDGDAGSFARQAFETGIRELRFLPGTTLPELVRLLDPVARALLGHLNPVDEDLSVLLWEADLGHIGYCLYEEPEPSHSPVEGAEEEAGGGPLLDPYVDRDLPIGGEVPAAHFTRLGEDERMALVAGYRKEEDEEIPRKSGRMLLALLRGETEPATCERFRCILIEYLDALASAHRFATISDLAGKVEPGGAAISAAADALAEVGQWFRRPERIYEALGAGEARPADAEAALRIVVGAPAEMVPELLARANDGGTGALASRDGLLARLPSEPAVLLACLNDARPEVRVAALDRFTPVPEAVRPLREILRDPDPAMRRRGASCLARVPGRAGLPGLHDALSDTDESVRIAAAEALGHRGGAQSLEPLLRVVTGHDFGRRSEAEHRAFLLAAGRAAPLEVWPILARIAERRSFWSRAAKRSTRDAALFALARMGPEVYRLLSERWVRKAELLARVGGYAEDAGTQRRWPAGASPGREAA